MSVWEQQYEYGNSSMSVWEQQYECMGTAVLVYGNSSMSARYSQFFFRVADKKMDVTSLLNVQ